MCNCSNKQNNCAFCSLPPAVLDAFVSVVQRQHGSDVQTIQLSDWLISRIPDDDDDEVLISQILYRVRTPKA